MRHHALVTPAPLLSPRQAGVNSVCGFYSSDGRLHSDACSAGTACLQLTTLTPAAAYCAGSPPITACFDGANVPTTACNSNQACCSIGSTCGQFVINSGAVTDQFCWTTSFSHQATNTAFIGYKATVSPSPTDRSSSSDSTGSVSPSPTRTSSGSASTGAVIGILVGLLVFVIAIIGFLWWCCFGRKNSWWKNRRRKKYQPVPEPLIMGTPAPSFQSTAAPITGYSKIANELQGESYPNSGVPPIISQSVGYATAGIPSQTPATGSYANTLITPQRPSSSVSAQTRIPAYMQADGGYESAAMPHSTSSPPPTEQPPKQSLAERPSGALEWKPSEPGTRTLTYQVEFIPNYIPVEKVKELFSFVDSRRVTVRSLAPSIGTLGRGSKTATVEFASLIKGSRGPDLSSEADISMNISVDRRFMGWTPLNNPSTAVHADVIAVTGLAGHAFGSWAHNSHQMWLRDFLPQDIPNIRVMTYGYDSQLTEQLSRQDLNQHAKDFAARLESLWQSHNYQRPTIFIGHSLGCLIIKQALILSRGWKGRPERLEKIVPQLIFMGAPHGGLATEALMTLVKGKASESLIEDLKPGSPSLKTLTIRFAEIAQNIRILSIYERLPTKSAIEKNGKWVREGPPVMMVEEQYALTYLPLERELSSQTDHKQIAKLKHTEGTYGAVINAIGNVLQIPVKQPTFQSDEAFARSLSYE